MMMMCSAEECEERLKSGEVSRFEKTNNEMDPRKMVTKYRRSAAGTKQRSPRNFEQLEATVTYLLHLLVNVHDESFLDIVHFLEDRLRAVQVDLTKLACSSCMLQYRMAKTHILILYLLSDSTKKAGKTVYERKFGITALQTAFSNYWIDDAECDNREDGAVAMMPVDAEMISLSILTHLNEYVFDIKDHLFQGDGRAPSLSKVWFHVVALSRRHCSPKQPQLHNDAPLGWTMGLLARFAKGQWQCCLSWLQQAPTATEFSILARCSVVCLVPVLRWLILQRFNRTLSKNQTISIGELSRLLVFANRDLCFEFVRNCGLPVDEPSQSVTFKSVDILPPQQALTWRNDDFILGENVAESAKSREGIPLPSSQFMQGILLN